MSQNVILETQRLRLLMWEPGDSHLIQQLHATIATTRYLSGAAPWSIEKAQERLSTWFCEHAKHGTTKYKILSRADDRFIGRAGFSLYHRADNSKLRAQPTPLCPAGHLPLKGGDRQDEGASFYSQRSIEAEDHHESISPLEGEMSGRTEGGKPRPLAINSESAEPEFELGYSLSHSEWGKGYATEIASALRDWFFERNFGSTFIAFTHPDNGASQNVLTKIGMRCRMPMIIDGLECPTFEYSAQMRS